MKLKHKTLITNNIGAGLEFVTRLNNKEMIDIETLHRFIDMNVSRTPDDLLSVIFNTNCSKNDYIPLFKLKVFHLWMDLICDAERFEFDDEKEVIAINGLRYITQKLLYSYMYDTDIRDWKATISPLWYSSCVKLFLEASSAFTDVDEALVSNSVKWLKSEVALKMWGDYSSFSHGKNKDPFIKGDLWVISKVWDNLVFITEVVIPKIYDAIEKYLKGNEVLVYFNVFRTWTWLIVDNNEKPDIKNLRIMQDVDNKVKINLKNMQWLSFLEYNKATGFSNSTFIRAFNHIKPITKEQKIKLAAYSHKELYANVDLLKYRKNGSTFKTLNNKESTKLIRERVEVIVDNIGDNIEWVNLEEL